ncbi:hypothetical protein AB0I81_53975 [Nonomuraea sp. NPDC050404]|uniref:hypothetical protein n=1 Tax=Nonomuraea sp. NPDC050404 TaxID=3155783 RepID=UPI0033F89209
MRLRRARCLVCYWHENEFVVHPDPIELPVEAAPPAGGARWPSVSTGYGHVVNA